MGPPLTPPFFLVSLLMACSEPLPAEKSTSAGDWRAQGVSLRITQDGQVEYHRRTSGGSNSINAPIQRFEGNNFVVGVGPFNTSFVVSQPPHLDDGVWKMTVACVELIRGGGSGTRA